MADAKSTAFQREVTPTGRQDGITEACTDRTSSVWMDKGLQGRVGNGFPADRALPASVATNQIS